MLQGQLQEILDVIQNDCSNACINVKPEGGGDPGQMWDI